METLPKASREQAEADDRLREERHLTRLSLQKSLAKLQKDLEHGTISEFDGIDGIIKFLRRLLEHIEVE